MSERNVNLENVGRALRTGDSDRRETDGREFLVHTLLESECWIKNGLRKRVSFTRGSTVLFLFA